MSAQPVRFTVEETARLVTLAAARGGARTFDERLSEVLDVLVELAPPGEVDSGPALAARRASLREGLVARVQELLAEHDRLRRASPFGSSGYRAKGTPGLSERDHRLVEILAPLVASAAGEMPAEVAPDSLSTRERAVARLVARGLGDREIAQELGIAFATVRTHLKRAFEKLGVANRTELARRFVVRPKKT